jgi:hypothetical protein
MVGSKPWSIHRLRTQLAGPTPRTRSQAVVESFDRCRSAHIDRSLLGFRCAWISHGRPGERGSDERANADSRAKAQSSYERAKSEYDKLAVARPATEVQSLIDTARAELKILGPTRSSAELQALMDGIKQDPRSGDCVAIQGSTKMRCPKVAEWRTEKARAEKRERLTADLTLWIDEKGRSDLRDKLQSEMKSASAELAQLGPAKVVNSDAQALASYLAAVGLKTTPDQINKLLVILAVLVIECGGGLALAVGMSLAYPDRQEHSAQDRRVERPNPPVPELSPGRRTTMSASLPNQFPQPQTHSRGSHQPRPSPRVATGPRGADRGGTASFCSNARRLQDPNQPHLEGFVRYRSSSCRSRLLGNDCQTVLVEDTSEGRR